LSNDSIFKTDLAIETSVLTTSLPLKSKIDALIEVAFVSAKSIFKNEVAGFGEILKLIVFSAKPAFFSRNLIFTDAVLVQPNSFLPVTM